MPIITQSPPQQKEGVGREENDYPANPVKILLSVMISKIHANHVEKVSIKVEILLRFVQLQSQCLN